MPARLLQLLEERVLVDGLAVSLTHGHTLGCQGFAEPVSTDAAEGLAALKEKRAPNFHQADETAD